MVGWKEQLSKIKKKLKPPQIDSVKTRDRVANISLDEILAKNENVKPLKIEIDSSVKKNIVLPTPDIHQNVVKTKTN